MNTRLKTLFHVYKIRKKDRHEIRQIFSLLSTEKQIDFLNKFPQFVENLHRIQKEMIEEQRILLGDIMDDFKKVVDREKRKQIVMHHN